MDFGRGCMTQMVTEESLRKTLDFYPDQDTSLEKKKLNVSMCSHEDFIVANTLFLLTSMQSLSY